jgi:hypothetical protein
MFERKLGDNVVYVANGMLEAESVRILLESFQIPAYVNQESAGLTYGLTVGPLGEVDVLVPSDYLEQANGVIADMKNGLLEQPGSSPEEDAEDPDEN